MTLIDESEIEEKLEKLEGWRHEDAMIVKTFENADFVTSVEFVNKLVEPAEELGHHPDLEISWNQVTVTISTHSEGGLTAADFDLAERIERL